MADFVTQSAGTQKKARHEQGICVDDPQRLGFGGCELFTQQRECGVENRVVYTDQKETTADNGEESPVGKLNAS